MRFVEIDGPLFCRPGTIQYDTWMPVIGEPTEVAVAAAGLAAGLMRRSASWSCC